jgi:hypothetical protein
LFYKIKYFFIHSTSELVSVNTVFQQVMQNQDFVNGDAVIKKQAFPIALQQLFYLTMHFQLRWSQCVEYGMIWLL